MTRTERTYYLVFGLYNFSWSAIGPVYALFLLSRGLDLFQINAVLATYLIVAFLFEVPTGAVADVFGRKVSFLLSCALRMTAFTMYAFSDTFTEFLLAEAVDAIGTTLASGALDAWAVDGIRAEGDRRATDRLFARAHVLARVLMISIGIAGGYAADLNIVIPWLVGASGFALTGLTALVLMKESSRPPRPQWSSAGDLRRIYGGTLTGAVACVRDNPVVGALCLLSMAAAFAIMPMHQLWQPRLQSLAGGGLWIMGWIWALLNVSAMIGSMLVPRLVARHERATLLCVTTCWRAAMLAMAALSSRFSLAAAGFVLQEISFGIGEPLLQAWMNENVPSERRATILSVRSMAFTLGGAIGLFTLGLVARRHGIPVAWLIGAAALAAVAIGFFALGHATRRAVALKPAVKSAAT